MSDKSYLAFDLGASSGRAILGTLRDEKMQMQELHRFETSIIDDGHHLYWDIDALWNDLKHGLKMALDEADDLRSLSVDSWAVDYVPLDTDGRAIRNPFCYRDTRTDDDIEAVHARVAPEEIYAATGIQHLPFNTIFQIYDDHVNRPDEVQATQTRLMIADYFNYRFSGHPVVEISNASTTQLVDPVQKTWSGDLIGRLGFDKERFPRIVDAGTCLSGTEESGGVPVVCGLSHDTGCAVAAVPASAGSDWMYLSSGTWSLLGAELQTPILSSEAFRQSYTNELGVDGTVRFLKNMTGMWALEECIREWKKSGQQFSYSDLFAEAASVDWTHGTIDLDSPGFGERGEMEKKIIAACEQHSIRVPKDRAEVVRLILESLADNYKEKAETLSRLAGLSSDAVVHIVGGGSQNHLLNQLTANACRRRVIAGPSESSALGNLLVQARAIGDLSVGSTIRQLARNTSNMTEYYPAG